MGVVPVPAALASTQIDLIGPDGSGQFGMTATVLSNGNIVVIDPIYIVGATAQDSVPYLPAVDSALIGSLSSGTLEDGGVCSQRERSMSSRVTAIMESLTSSAFVLY